MVRRTARSSCIRSDFCGGVPRNGSGSCKRQLEMTASPVFPVAKDDDDDDVAWALSTAQVQWKRGSQADAVVWLRRAIDSAVAIGATWRAAELTRETDALEQFVLYGPAEPAEPFVPVASQGDVAIDDFDGTDIIDAEAMSLPPDAQMDDVDGLLAGDS